MLKLFISLGFLQHRQAEQQKSSDLVFGEIWLFFGCRYEDKDFLYRLVLHVHFLIRMTEDIKINVIELKK
jgi:sulfite reductase alpha subunit-like flavoprotein